MLGVEIWSSVSKRRQILCGGQPCVNIPDTGVDGPCVISPYCMRFHKYTQKTLQKKLNLTIVPKYQSNPAYARSAAGAEVVPTTALASMKVRTDRPFVLSMIASYAEGNELSMMTVPS